MPDTVHVPPAPGPAPAAAADPARRLWQLWREGQRPDAGAFLREAGSLTAAQAAAVLRVDQRERWLAGERVPAEDYLRRFAELQADADYALDLVYGEYLLREELGEAPPADDYARRFPAFASQLRLQLELRQALDATSHAGPSTDPAGGESSAGPAGPPAAAPPAPAVPGYEVAGLLGRVAEEYQQRLERGERPDAQEYARRHPEAAAALRRLLPALEALVRADRATDPPGAVEAPPPPGPPGYELLGELGRGGMGVVYKARDGKLNRVVALKMVLAGRHATPDELERFQAEAEAVAALRHPNVVQVYEVGRHDGLPFFTLEFVPGGALAARLKGQALPPLDAARLVEAVARGVQAAHERNIIHRDLKPANVLLEEGPETPPGRCTPRVTDFGLARRVEGAGRTQTGAVLGTPSYMAPEQAAGKGKEAGPAADVYALGAVLYECLTGRPPFSGLTPLETLAQVLDREPVAVRALQPGVPRDLETVCLMCLHKDPKRRYAGARELADDLGRFVQGKPILARPVGVLERGWLWCRRNPAVASLLAAVFVSLLAGAATAWALALRERDARTQAEQAEQKERKRAETEREARRDAQQAVNDMYTRVAEKWLAQEAQLEEVQREFLEKALRFYERMAASEDSSPEIRREAGRAARRAAEIQDKLGDHGAADASYRRSESILESLGDDDLARAELAGTENSYGLYLWDQGKRPDKALQRALDIGQELADRRPALVHLRATVAATHSRFGLIHAARGQFKEAESSHLRAIAIANKSSNNPTHRANQARGHNNLTNVYRQVGRFRDADTASARAVEIMAALAAEFPRDPAYRLTLAFSLSERATLLTLLGKRKDAEELLRQATDVADRLTADFPGSIAHQDLALWARRDLAVMRGSQGNQRMAEPELRRAIASTEQLTQRYPDMPKHWRNLAVHRSSLGDLLRSKGQPDDAQKECVKALAISEQLVARHPDILEYRSLRALYKSTVALLLRVTAKHEESNAAYDRAIADMEALVQEFPTVLQLRHYLSNACAQKAAVLNLLKRPKDAEPLLERAIGLIEALAQEHDLASYHLSDASSLTELAQIVFDRDDAERCRTLLERSNQHLASVLKVDPDSNGPRYFRMRNLGLLGQLRAKAGDLRAADAAARELESIPNTGHAHFNASAFLSEVGSAVKKSSAAEADRDMLLKSLSDRCFDQLRKAIAAGYRNIALIKMDVPLIHDREDYKKLVEQVERELKEKSGGK
jgi:tetratricopeptide (TPR) repeat protein/tRNA A-37 threonylcarbamoyl transferase component Bud32